MERCRDKNVMVCKACLVQHLLGVSLTTQDNEFAVYCFDSGDVHNYVRSHSQETIHLQTFAMIDISVQDTSQSRWPWVDVLDLPICKDQELR